MSCVPSTVQPLPSMCLVTINEPRPPTDLYILRLPFDSGAGFHDGRGPLLIRGGLASQLIAGRTICRCIQNAPVEHLTIDTKDLLMGSRRLSHPLHLSRLPTRFRAIYLQGILSLLTPSLASSSFPFSIFAGLSPEGASPLSPFNLRGSPQVPCVNTFYDELIKQGYPGNSLIALERREVLRRTIANEIA